MKNIFVENSDKISELERLANIKQDLLNNREKEMSDAFRNIDRKYFYPIHENENKLEKCEQLINSANIKLSELSKFNKPMILFFIVELLQKIEGEKYSYVHTKAIYDIDSPFTSPIMSGSIHVIGKGEIADKFMSNSFPLDPKKIEISQSSIDDAIIIQESIIPFIHRECIAFYDTRGERTINTKGYRYIYEFINCLINYRYNNMSNELTYNEYREQFEKFVNSYPLKKINYADEDKRQVKNDDNIAMQKIK